ncbi:MAG: preprotein translocase subunit SecA [Blastopirellula sp.]|nr:preprotein translocase subunit SecA [Blastopirellula sp.]
MLNSLPVPSSLHLARWRKLLPQFETLEASLQNESDRELRKRSLSLRFQAKSGEKLRNLVPEGFALMREAARRTLGMRHFDVQMLGGLALINNCIAEMETGEGKTLTATLPMYLHALIGRGAQLATVNDYLAERDAETMRPAYEMLGMTVGVVLTPDKPDQRRAAYACDITYGTAKEFGFDFLRDRLLLRRMGRDASDFLGEGSSQRWDASGEQPVQRGAHFALVDEADSILIDEARTPLIIGTLGGKAREQVEATFNWAAANAEKFIEDQHFDYEHDTKKVELNAAGRQLLRSLPTPPVMRSVGLIDLYQYTERAIKVQRDFLFETHYVIDEGEIVIVDENTGRRAEGRKWRDGIHQAIEAKEQLEVSVPTGQAARITIQDLFLRYRHLAGMTGTAISAAREFRKIYKMPVVRIPTNRPSRREQLQDQIFGNARRKWEAIAAEVHQLHQAGRPILIGTKSIDKSELLSQLLAKLGVEHQVLNANEVAKEAEIVALAGQPGRVTVATNMAGRGTDIKLGEGVAECGGLHVICTELHDSARIDRQLIGRCGRQGDPGTFRKYMALDDEILKVGFGPQTAERLASKGSAQEEEMNSYGTQFLKSQRKVERKHFRDRSILLHHEKERKKMQREMGQDPYLDTAD